YIIPSFYKEIITITFKKYKEFWIESKYGLENQIGFIENCNSEYYKEMTENYDEFWDYHLDSLKWLDYPFNWQSVFYKFPRPEINEENHLGKYICSQLISGSSKVHSLEPWYLERLFLSIDQLCEKIGWRHIYISTPKTNHFYNECSKKAKVSNIINSDIGDICDIVWNSSAFIGIDSAWRLLGYAKEIPTITLSKDCQNYAQVPHSHRIRWLIHPQWTFGLHVNTNQIIDLISKMIENPIYQKWPELALTNQSISDILIKRDYKVNLEKSKL
ncbi:MAG: hypothetical protein AABY22_35395, partial [Nanoarchaeota archaeon]